METFTSDGGKPNVTEYAVKGSVTLYPDHWLAIEEYARKLGLRGPRTTSPALQAMIDKLLEYERQAATPNGQEAE